MVVRWGSRSRQTAGPTNRFLVGREMTGASALEQVIDPSGRCSAPSADRKEPLGFGHSRTPNPWHNRMVSDRPDGWTRLREWAAWNAREARRFRDGGLARAPTVPRRRSRAVAQRQATHDPSTGGIPAKRSGDGGWWGRAVALCGPPPSGNRASRQSEWAGGREAGRDPACVVDPSHAGRPDLTADTDGFARSPAASDTGCQGLRRTGLLQGVIVGGPVSGAPSP